MSPVYNYARYQVLALAETGGNRRSENGDGAKPITRRRKPHAEATDKDGAIVYTNRE